MKLIINSHVYIFLVLKRNCYADKHSHLLNGPEKKQDLLVGQHKYHTLTNMV